VAPVGAYPLALAAHDAGVPFLVCATTTAIDPALASGDAATLEDGRPGPVLRVAGGRVVPEGTAVRNRLQDLVPAGLVTAIVTEGGVLRGPFEASVAQAVADSTARRGRPASSPEATVA
jgi:methylthioribose-1-phosphate isomerase